MASLGDPYDLLMKSLWNPVEIHVEPYGISMTDLELQGWTWSGSGIPELDLELLEKGPLAIVLLLFV